ncbi:glycosyltransferase family 4 protein [Mucilaginibacter sp. UR6-1]|uniref:glycosyltransferase family 4 protein n=1 Tax=Mucilaginibacter sp. UR6-1 TaxID=1435643 RepID=UPI001E6272F8|nr:glycosyltransferase family 4 protein [Mucilaginibacter sp. UR6-1]MCC8408162.1 glycosyltransferase family 4 protein [Mucilaginibacter sp. UR6-1]
MNIVLSHPTGNRNVRAVIASLAKAGMLSAFNTTLATHQDSAWLKLLPAKVRAELMRRSFQVPTGSLYTRPALELVRMTLPRLGINSYTEHEKGWASIDAVYRDLDKATAKRLRSFAKSKSVNAVYAYEDGALFTFKEARRLGLKCIYDLPIAYWETAQKLLNEEALRMPEWAVTLGGGINDSEAKLERKTRELELADVVVGPGSFVMNSLPEWAKEKQIIVSPFGSPKVGEVKNTTKNTDAPLRVLFAGSMGQRKGLGDLFKAIKLLDTKKVEFVVMGSLLAPMDFYREQLDDFTYEPGRSHDQVLELMRSCDVFCLPSIVEGRALVMQEAMSQGLPIIITPNTGGADLVDEGETGFLVDIRSPEAIAQKIAWFADNREMLPKMSKAAQIKAAGYTWENYGDNIIHSLTNYTH